MKSGDERPRTGAEAEPGWRCVNMTVTPSGPVMTLLQAGLLATGFVFIPAVAGVVSGGFHLLPWCLPFAVMVLVYRQLLARGQLGSGRARLDGGTLVLEGQGRRRRLKLDDVRGGSRAAASTTLQFRSGAQASLSLHSEHEAESLLDQTGTSVGQRTLSLQLRGTIGPFVAGLLFFFALYTPVWLGLAAVLSVIAGLQGWELSSVQPAAVLLSLATSAALGWWLARVRSPKVTIGQDGVVIERWLRRRFVPHSAIRSVTRSGMSVDLALGDETVSLATIGWSEEQELAALRRLHDARALFDQARDAGPERDALFARRGQNVAEWREQLLDAGFRRRVVTDADAESVLNDATQPLEHRAGAALALRALDPAQGERRVRVAAEVAADPRAREVLLGMLEADAEVEATLRRLTR